MMLQRHENVQNLQQNCICCCYEAAVLDAGSLYDISGSNDNLDHSVDFRISWNKSTSKSYAVSHYILLYKTESTTADKRFNQD